MAGQPAKLIHVGGVLHKQETTYATAVAVSNTTDGFEMHLTDRNSLPVPEIDYAYQGESGLQPGNLGILRRQRKHGRFFRVDLPAHSKGFGAAYSASNLPSLHRMILASGFDAAIVTTGGAETVTYSHTAPDSVGTSLTCEYYGRKEKFTGIGVLADWKWAFTDGAPPLHTFTHMGVMPTDVAEASTPTITYAHEGVDAAPAALCSLVLGNFTAANARVLSGSFALNRAIDNARGFFTDGTHMGFVPNGRRPEFTVAVESTAFTGSPYTAAAAFDAYKLEEIATELSFSITFGTAQYLKETYTMAQAQVIRAVPGVHNGVATMEITLAAVPSSPTGVNDMSVLFN